MQGSPLYLTHFTSLRRQGACMRQLIWPPLVQIMASRMVGTKPLSEPLLACVARRVGKNSSAICVNSSWFKNQKHWNAVCRMMVTLSGPLCESWFTEATWRMYMQQKTRPPMVRIMACRLAGTRPLSKPLMDYWLFGYLEQKVMKVWWKLCNTLLHRKL